MTTHRQQELTQQGTLAGVDFVYVHPEQTVLDVYFLQTQQSPQMTLGALIPMEMIELLPEAQASRVAIALPAASDGAPNESLALAQAPSWVILPSGQEILRVRVASPGASVPYRLTLTHPQVDPFFNHATFSFQANCPRNADCAKEVEVRPTSCEGEPDFLYPARDFESLREALLTFAEQHYPGWKDRWEGDVGVMLMECLAALGDEFSYLQDQIYHEAFLETATQGRSLQRMARLVDDAIDVGCGASGWLEVTAKAGMQGHLASGEVVTARPEREPPIFFEVGEGLRSRGYSYPVNADVNRLSPFLWDESNHCLPRGRISLDVEGHWKSALVLQSQPGKVPGRWMMLREEPSDLAKTPKRHLVRVIEVKESTDPLTSKAITTLRWEEAQATPTAMVYQDLSIRGNLVPITAGRTTQERFVVGSAPDTLVQGMGVPTSECAAIGQSIVRTGPNATSIHRWSLPDPNDEGVVWFGEEGQTQQPECVVEEVVYQNGGWSVVAPWSWRASLLGVEASSPQHTHVTLEPGTWGRVVSFWREGEEFVHRDYAANKGWTLRFGDNQFGLTPAQGKVFQVTYRLGHGHVANVAAGAVRHIESNLAFVEAVENPLAIENGRDPESLETLRVTLPQRYRHERVSAVRPEDYAAIVKALDWVQQAGATLRWTGSWLAQSVTPDPRGQQSLSTTQVSGLTALLDSVRQAGREVLVQSPRYVDLGLRIRVCVEAASSRRAVRDALEHRLFGGVEEKCFESKAFFAPDALTFGMSLSRAQLEAVCQEVPGVKAIEGIEIQRAGFFDWKPWEGGFFPVASHEILRITHDPHQAHHGFVQWEFHGGI